MARREALNSTGSVTIWKTMTSANTISASWTRPNAWKITPMMRMKNHACEPKAATGQMAERSRHRRVGPGVLDGVPDLVRGDGRRRDGASGEHGLGEEHAAATAGRSGR